LENELELRCPAGLFRIGLLPPTGLLPLFPPLLLPLRPPVTGLFRALLPLLPLLLSLRPPEPGGVRLPELCPELPEPLELLELPELPDLPELPELLELLELLDPPDLPELDEELFEDPELGGVSYSRQRLDEFTFL
jgi:hypothetical protein